MERVFLEDYPATVAVINQDLAREAQEATARSRSTAEGGFWQDAYERAMRMQDWRDQWRGAWEWYQVGYRLDVIAKAMRTDLRSTAVSLRVYQDWLDEYPADYHIWKDHRRGFNRFLKLYGEPEPDERARRRRRHPNLAD